MSRPEALGIAKEVYEEHRATGKLFTLTSVFNETLDRCAHLAPSALEGLVAWAVDRADKFETSSPDAPKQHLLFDLDGAYKLGGAERIDKRHALLHHLLKVLELNDGNRRAVDTANDELHQEFDRLQPYLGPGVSKAEAVAAYDRDHPSAQSA